MMILPELDLDVFCELHGSKLDDTDKLISREHDTGWIVFPIDILKYNMTKMRESRNKA